MTGNGTLLRWGILGTAAIAVDHVIPAIAATPGCVVAAVAGRDADRAGRVAAELGAARSHGSYEALLDDEEIDCVYVPLPNSLHAEWSSRFLRAGRAVLCEKPLAVTVAEAEEMVAASRSTGSLLVEGFMYRHHPQIDHLMGLLRDGTLGPVHLVRGSIGFRLEGEGNIRSDPALGGGALLDVGCYVLDAAGLVFDAEPVAVTATAFRRDGIDELTAALVEYPDERLLVMDCQFRLPWRQAPLEVVGERATCRLENAYNPGRSVARMTLLRDGAKPEPLTFPRTDMYAELVAAFAAALRTGGDPPYPLEQSLRTARALAAVRRAASVEVAA